MLCKNVTSSRAKFDLNENTNKIGCTGGDTDKQLVAWGRRAKVLRRMVLGFAQARPPDPPAVVAVDITATATVAVRLQEPSMPDSPLTTRYKSIFIFVTSKSIFFIFSFFLSIYFSTMVESGRLQYNIRGTWITGHIKASVRCRADARASLLFSRRRRQRQGLRRLRLLDTCVRRAQHLEGGRSTGAQVCASFPY